MMNLARREPWARAWSERWLFFSERGVNYLKLNHRAAHAALPTSAVTRQPAPRHRRVPLSDLLGAKAQSAGGVVRPSSSVAAQPPGSGEYGHAAPAHRIGPRCIALLSKHCKWTGRASGSAGSNAWNHERS